MTERGARLSDEQYDALLTVVSGSNIRSELAGAVLNLIREHRQFMDDPRAERVETARLRAALERVREYGDRQAVGIAEAALAESEG